MFVWGIQEHFGKLHMDWSPLVDSEDQKIEEWVIGEIFFVKQSCLPSSSD